MDNRSFGCLRPIRNPMKRSAARKGASVSFEILEVAGTLKNVPLPRALCLLTRTRGAICFETVLLNLPACVSILSARMSFYEK